MFDYIYTAQCQRLISMVWDNDLTYALNTDGVSKALSKLRYNGPSCNSKKLDFLEKSPFINTTQVKLNEAIRKWMIYKTAELGKWKKAIARSF